MKRVLWLTALAALVAAASQTDTTPQTVHLAVGNTATEYVVMWLTLAPTPTSEVRYGTAATALNRTATGTARVYDHVGGGWNHVVAMDGLATGTRVFYAVGSPSTGFSRVFSFLPRRAASVTTPFSFGIYGDLGWTNGAATRAAVNAAVVGGEWDLVVHAGDISYANDHPWDFERLWREWLTDMEPAMTTAPYMVAAGNHESWCRNPICAVQTANFTTYKYKFQMPGAACGSDTNMFYSFDYRSVHFVVISTESDFPDAPIDPLDADPYASLSDKEYKQLNWIASDLAAAAANRVAVPWIIVVGHRPMYTSGSEHQVNGTLVKHAAALAAWLEPLFHKYSVDVYFSGHQHHYVRMWPTYDATPYKSYNPAPATTYLVSGAAGNAEGHDPVATPAIWQAAANYNDYGYSAVTVHNATHLSFEFVASASGDLLDHVMIVRTRRSGAGG